MQRRYGCRNVGAGKVVALVEQRFPCRSSKRVGEAVTIVQPCRMPALAEPSPGTPRRFEMGGGDRDGFDCCMLKERVQLAAGLRPASTLNHDGRFQNVGHRHSTRCRGSHRRFKATGIGFPIQHCKQSGTVDDHLGKPWSS